MLSTLDSVVIMSVYVCYYSFGNQGRVLLGTTSFLKAWLCIRDIRIGINEKFKGFKDQETYDLEAQTKDKNQETAMKWVDRIHNKVLVILKFKDQEAYNDRDNF
jgi:hypothetical protein